MKESVRTSWKHEAALLAVVLIWGVNFAVLKAALAMMHPHVVNAFRFIVSTVVLGALYADRNRRMGRSFFAPLRTHGKQIAGLGLLGYFAYQIAFIVGISHTTAGNAGLIMASAPLWTAVVGRLFGLEILRRLAWFGLLLTLIGTILVVAAGSEVRLGGGVLYGNLLMLGAALAWGAHTALSRPVLRTVSPSGLAFLGLLFALPFLFLVALPHFGAVRWAEVTWWVWVAIFFSGGLSTGLALAVWNLTVQRVGASQTAVYGNLVPLVALLSGVLLLGESVVAGQIVGGMLIIGGVLTMRRARRPALSEQA